MHFDIRRDDLSGEATRALLALHLSGMQATSPAGHVYALFLPGLQATPATATPIPNARVRGSHAWKRKLSRAAEFTRWGIGRAAFSWEPRNGDIRSQAGLSAVPSLLIDQDCLLPSAWRLVGAVNATRPAAGSLLPLQQFVTGSLDATLTRPWLFRVIHPADELISTERRQALPQYKDIRIRSHCCLKIFTCFVDSALRKSVCHETSKQCRPPAEFVGSG